MARSRESKEQVLQILQGNLEKSSAVFFVNLQGLTVKQADTLRRECRKNDLTCMMAKKTLIRRAFQQAKIEGVDFKALEGEVAATFSYTDEVTPAKVLDKFKKEHEKFQILGGVVLSGPVGVQILSTVSIIQLSRLPSHEELLGQLVGTLANPLRGMVGVLQGPMRGLITVLQGLEKKHS